MITTYCNKSSVNVISKRGWVTNGWEHRRSGQGTTHIPGGTEHEGARFHRATQKGLQCKTVWIVISGIFHLMFSDLSWLLVRKPLIERPRIRGDHSTVTSQGKENTRSGMGPAARANSLGGAVPPRCALTRAIPRAMQIKENKGNTCSRALF